LTAIFKLKA